MSVSTKVGGKFNYMIIPYFCGILGGNRDGFDGGNFRIYSRRHPTQPTTMANAATKKIFV